MTLKLIINEYWASLDQQVGDVLNRFKQATRRIKLEIVTETTNYTYIPFQHYPPSFGRPAKIIDRDWYKKEITPRGWGYDVVAFVVPQSQWQGEGIGGVTNWNAGRYEIELTANENQQWPYPALSMSTFANSLLHELSHALKQMYRVLDDTHSYLLYDKFDLAGALLFLNTHKMNQVKVVKSKHTPTVYLCYPVPSMQHLKERSDLEGFEIPAEVPTTDVL